MSLNHDQFIATTNYTNLNTLLQWYIGAVGPHLGTLKTLAKYSPAKAKALYLRDPVLQKLVTISEAMRPILERRDD